MSFEIIVKDPRWETYLEQIEARTYAVEAHIFKQHNMCVTDFESAILLCDDQEIAKLNQEFRTKDRPTDILSWPSFESTRVLGAPPKPIIVEKGPFATQLGDMALAFETCMTDSHGKTFIDHITHLLAHGFLHLIGYDHIEELDGNLMESLEISILDTLGIKNPYNYDTHRRHTNGR